MEEESIPQQESTSSSSDLPQYESGEDYDKATTYKMEAADLKSSGDYPASLEKYNLAITSAPPSALLLANRADVLFRLERFEDAVGDCDRALENNPDRLVFDIIFWIRFLSDRGFMLFPFYLHTSVTDSHLIMYS
jgi:tetratricopeptide (TPR) repeat protein